MDYKILLQQIEALIDKKLFPIKEQLDTMEMKIEVVNKKIGESQKDTIEVLSELIETAYNMHEGRIKKLEDHMKSSSAQ